jgi:hypothetical protein
VCAEGCVGGVGGVGEPAHNDLTLAQRVSMCSQLVVRLEFAALRHSGYVREARYTLQRLQRLLRCLPEVQGSRSKRTSGHP